MQPIDVPTLEEKLTPAELINYTAWIQANRMTSLFGNSLLNLIWTMVSTAYVAGSESRPLERSDFEDVTLRWISDRANDSVEFGYRIDSSTELAELFGKRFEEIRLLDDPEVVQYLLLQKKYKGFSLSRYEAPI